MIKNIVFDMGGVILDFNLKKTVEKEFAPEYHDVIYEHVFGENSVWKTLDEGIYTFDQVIPGILEKLPEELHEKVSAMVTDFYDYMPPFPETCELIKELKENGYKAKLVLQIHDELIIDCPKNEADNVATILKEEMENAVKLSVPLTVEVAVGQNWYETK
jgi:beta-phosphoglucomutase-like phosphatase (HAD superfamily)